MSESLSFCERCQSHYGDSHECSINFIGERGYLQPNGLVVEKRHKKTWPKMIVFDENELRDLLIPIINFVKGKVSEKDVGWNECISHLFEKLLPPE